jgi:hypothetical protein
VETEYGFTFKMQPYEDPDACNNKTNGNSKFLQPYYVTAADALLEIGMAIISTIYSLSKHLSQTNISCVLKCSYQLVYQCLIRYLPRYVKLGAS